MSETNTVRSFYGYCNGKTSKSECAKFSREYTEIITVPVQKNGAIITGKNLVKDGGSTVLKKDLYNGKCLVVLDFDVIEGGSPLTIDDIPEKCRNTFLVSSGSGGIHAYFWSNDFIRSTKNTNMISPKLRGIDIKAEGGIIFAPGSSFDEHKQRPYTIIKDSPLDTISKITLDLIMEEIVKPEIILRKGFRMMLDGEIWITHAVQQQTGVEEHNYWSALVREILSLGGNPRDYYDLLDKNQPEFKRDIFDYQLMYMINNDKYNPYKRPSNIFYNKLFGPWDTRELLAVPEVEEEAVPWYYDFDSYWYDMYSETIKWIYESKQWVRYTAGVFLEIPEEEIERMVLDYFIEENVKRAPTNINIALRTIRANYYTSLHDYDKNKDLINVKNGLLNAKTKELKPHTPSYLSTIQLPLTYKSKPELTPYWNRIKNAYPTQMDIIERFIQAIILGDMNNELMMFVYGPTGSGKGTMLSVIKKMFEGVCSFQPVEKIGGDFGLSPLIGKLINLNLEMTIINIDAATMQILKSIVGKDEDVTVNMKHVRAFSYRFDRMFFINATNQLPTLAQTDIAAWFRRVLLINFNITQPRDYDMKNGIILEVDDIFSRLVNTEYIPLITNKTDMEEYVKKIEIEWKYSADPVQHICEDIFARTPDPSAIEIIDDCVNWVSIRLTEEKFGSIPFRKLKARVIDILSSLNIVAIRKDNSLCFKYIKIIDKKINLLRDEQIKEDIAEKSSIDIERVLTGDRLKKHDDYRISDWDSEDEALAKELGVKK